MKAEVASRRIESFGQRFGEAHLCFAYHAAFPLALTPDLLYRLWANFQRDIYSEMLSIPWLAVADLLLSSLCDEVGHELYEMDTAVRNMLLRELKANPRFGEKRINELSDFVLVYVQQQLESHDPDMRDFAQAQRWTALAYTRPSEAARELASILGGLKLEEKAEWVRMTSLVETFAEPLADFQPLLFYSRGMQNFARGNLESASAEFGNLSSLDEYQVYVAGVKLPIPAQIASIDILKSQENHVTEVEIPVQVEEDLSVYEQVEINPDTLEQLINPGFNRADSQSQFSTADYSSQNLRGRSFKGKNLSGANFSKADIRGADFTNAILRDVNFSGIKAGLQFLGVMGGTSFRGADLTNADFTGAILRNTDFREANITRTRWYEAKGLDSAKVSGTYLADIHIRSLLVTGNGRSKSYFGANLKGANLIGADLKEANLKDANITEATLQGACLEWANLTLAQAVGTDFTSAQMTGACVEAWNIASTTKLNNVDCRFIYLLENPMPGTDERERRPSSGDFQPGEFSKLFEEVLNTSDLIFRNGIDWKTFVNAFQNLQNQNEDTELVLQSIENKGDGVVVVKVGVPDGVDKEKIHSDFTQNYQLALQAVEEKYKAQLQIKDEEISI